jgi:hypothetical protein
VSILLERLYDIVSTHKWENIAFCICNQSLFAAAVLQAVQCKNIILLKIVIIMCMHMSA